MNQQQRAHEAWKREFYLTPAEQQAKESAIREITAASFRERHGTDDETELAGSESPATKR